MFLQKCTSSSSQHGTDYLSADGHGRHGGMDIGDGRNLSPCKFSGKSEVRDPPLHRFTELLVWGCKLFHPMWYSTFSVLAGSSLQDLSALNVELCTIERQNYAASSIHEFIKNITY